MKLQEFLHNINEAVKLNPEIMRYDVVYARDEEGNGFDIIHFEPSVGHFSDCEFTDHNSKDFEGELNSICIN